MKTEKKQIIASIALLAAALVFLAFADMQARARRFAGGSAVRGVVPVYRVPTQRDVYAVYRALGLHGAHAVHINRHLNLVDYFPTREKISRPFPIMTYDIRASYEEGLDSHNWLFIATRTGLVRRVTAIMPGEEFLVRSRQLEEIPSYTVKRGAVKGYAYDVPMIVASLESLPAINEPLVLSVDAGFFRYGAGPEEPARALSERLSDVRAIVLVDSTDEEDITHEDREALTIFLSVWGGTGG